ncbi:Frag1/DRAM/Sfk1 family-domain-containing protein [Boletus edulis BED1]|uniref:Frag1/DRAM/Sfk1 family-domain-containing protein n=1 Tax=Boletus edulis BED1 TaxID=1328754 RepID=A0AAD4GER2_BOLED|nr:Frag1/DRAM/Sfk1 family-domain-containing protein [Boletus edulis BED1]
MSSRTTGKHSTLTTVNQKVAPLFIDASHVAAVHTFIAFSAFTSALLLGCALHYKKIVKNGIAGYPEEWFPSVSATIGDWYPERNVFQILIAITSGPRFALIFLQYFISRTSRSALPLWIFFVGIVRTLACGGWVYVTSNDDHDAHDVLMILYIVCNVPWMLGGIMNTPPNHVQVRKRRFFALIIPLVYFFIQHKVHRIPGAYTRYAFFEWGLIFLDVLYDSISGADFRLCNLQIAIGVSLDSGIEHKDIPLPPAHDNKLKSVDDNTPEPNDKISSTVKTQPAIASNEHKSGTRGIIFRGGRLLTPLMKPALRSWLGFAADVYLSYLFWSIITSLLTTLFYFSVWELGLSGAEAALFTYFTPALLGITPLRNWALTKWGRVTLRVLSLIGLAAYRIDDPLERLWAVIGANIAILLSQMADWTTGDGAYQGFLLGVGLVLSSLSKHANHSNNPVWPMLNEETGGYNKTGMVIAVCAILELATRPSSPPIKEEKSGKLKQPPNNAKDIPRNWIASSIALGSLFFTLHCMFTDSSTIIAWSWTGYQDGQPRGPLPHLHGPITLLAQSLGLIIPAVLPTSASTALLSHPLWFAYGCASAFVMYRFRDWTGFLGGLNFAIFCMSILPSVLSQSSAWQGDKVGRRHFVTFLVAILLYLANVWTVAYAFVPGGSYLRERTDLVLAAQLAAISLASWPFGASTRPNSMLRIPSSTRTRIPVILCLLSLSSVLVTLLHWPVVGPTPYKPGTRTFNAGIWTIHFGIDNVGHDSQRRIRDVIRDMKLDVVGLLETDLHRTVYGNRDLTRVAAEELGYYVDLGPGPNLHTWGAALLSKFPIIHSRHHLLPSPHGELAPAIEAVLDVYGTEITVVVSHNGQEEDPLDRELQSKELARIMAASYPRPVVFLGYVVTKPLAPRPAPYDILVNDGLVYDIDQNDWDRWCEYILYRGVYRTAYARVSRGIVTDTELQIGQFVLPRHGYVLTNQTEGSRLLRSFKEDLPEHHVLVPNGILWQ